MLLADMSRAYAQLGDVGQACACAEEAVTITEQTKSRDVVERVRLALSELDTGKETKQVHVLESKLQRVSIATTF